MSYYRKLEKNKGLEIFSTFMAYLTQVYIMWLNLIFNVIIPLLTLTILNMAIYKKLNKVRPVTR